MVQPEKVDDVAMVKVAHDIREKIENEMTYPGQIKVTLIREVRVNELAK
jgi:ribonuclease Y